MARKRKQVPENYPQPLGMRILKAEGFRQASALRQEVVSDLIQLLQAPAAEKFRTALAQFIERNVQAGISAAEKANELWPDSEEAGSIIRKSTPKESQRQKHHELFDRLTKAHENSVKLLEESFNHARIIVQTLR